MQVDASSFFCKMFASERIRRSPLPGRARSG